MKSLRDIPDELQAAYQDEAARLSVKEHRRVAIREVQIAELWRGAQRFANKAKSRAL